MTSLEGEFPKPGDVVSHYEILSTLGEGGMGLVYKAMDQRLKRVVALKIMNRRTSDKQSGLKRFLSEAQTAAALDHPNICPIYEINEHDGWPFIVMAFIPGTTLLQKMRTRLLKIDEAFDMTRQVATGLHVAHERGVVHRDIKPANVLVNEEGVVKIADFGLAKMPEITRVTAPGGAVGTYPYMSPEQIRGEDVDRRSDLWSLGVMMYEMLTGVLPFVGDNQLTFINAVLRHDPKPISALRPAVPAGTDQVVLTLLQKAPARRYQTGRELIAELDRIAGKPASDGGTVATSPSKPAPSSRGSKSSDRRLPISIVVLPFANLSPDKENEYLCDGITEELIHGLGLSEGLRVVSRTSAFEFKGKTESVRAIAEKLKVDSVVEGGVRRAGDRLRVTVQIVDAYDGFPTWSAKFDRDMKDIFAVQDEIALSVANAFKVQLQPQARGSSLGSAESGVVEAYHEYLKGRYCWNQQTAESLQKAVAHFQKALELDPEYGAAHAGLADYFSMLGLWSLAPPEMVWGQARTSALRALELDDSLAEAHISLAYYELFYGWNFEKAEQEFLRAIQLNEQLSFAHYSYSVLLVVAGRIDEAIIEIKRAQILDPLSLLISSGLGIVYYYGRHYSEALEEHRKTLEIEPNYVYSNLGSGLAYQEIGKFAEAVAALEKACDLAQRSPLPLAFLGAGYAKAGHREKALAVLKELEEDTAKQYVSPVCNAVVYAALDDREQAIAWLNKGADSRAAILVYLPVLPVFDALRSDPRVVALVKKITEPDPEQETLPVTETLSAGEGGSSAK